MPRRAVDRTGWGWKGGKGWVRYDGDHGEIMGIWCQLDMDMMVNGLVWGHRLDFPHQN